MTPSAVAVTTELQVDQKTQENFSISKFHPVFGKELSVALESTLNLQSNKELLVDREIYYRNKNLIFRNGDCWRIYYPAVISGDVTTGQEAKIDFWPWFSGPQVLYNRLTFRIRPREGNFFHWMRFGRFQSEDAPEEKPFGFDPNKPPYISLDFFSKRNDNFLPLFVKIREDGGEFTYFVIEGLWNEDATLKIRRVTESETPSHLAAIKP